MLGPAAPELWREFDLSTYPVHARVDHGQQPRYSREGTGVNVLGDPRIALTWLVNELRAQGIGLLAGQFVTTGTCMVPLELVEGDTVEADFGVLGRLGMQFSD